MEEINNNLIVKVAMARSLKKGFDESYFDFSQRVKNAANTLLTDIQEFVKVLFVAGLEPLESASCYDNSTADLEHLVVILNQQFATIDQPKFPASVDNNGYETIKKTALPELPPEEQSISKKVYTKRHLLEHAFNMGSSPSLNGLQEFTKVCHDWINEKFPVAEEEPRKKFVKTFVAWVVKKS